MLMFKPTDCVTTRRSKTRRAGTKGGLTPETLELLSGTGTKAVNIIAATVERMGTENEEMRWKIEKRTKVAERPTDTHFKRWQPNTFVHGENKQETNQLQKSLSEQMTENHSDFHKQSLGHPATTTDDADVPTQRKTPTHADMVCKMFCLFWSLCCL